jgi:hypothetical protein
MVSYSSQDRDRVIQFVRALRASGVAVWIDQGGIDGAQRWSEEIVNAIEACRTVLLFISRYSMESQNIAKEVALAWEGGKHFLPVALEEAKIPKSMQYQLAGIQYVKLYEGDPDVKFESVLRALVRLGVRVSPYSMAVVSAGIGDREQALEWLEKACEERSSGLARLKSEPRFNLMRTDSRFEELSRRAESIALEGEDATAEIVLPQPLTRARAAAPTDPVPTWKRLLWPDISDDKSAREAAGLGVWTSVAIVAFSWFVSFVVPTSMMTAKSWWNDPIVLTVIWGAIGFSVQKMGRPAAAIGAGLCVLGSLFNLSVLSGLKTLKDMQQTYAQMGQQQLGQPDYSGLYYVAFIGTILGFVFVGALVNACRGTFAYRQMVVSGRAQDKQDALSPEDLLAARRKVMAWVQRVWGSGPLAPASTQVEAQNSAAISGPSSGPIPFRATSAIEPPLIAPAAAASPQTATAVGDPRPILAASAESLADAPTPPQSSQASALVTSPAVSENLDQFPEFDDAPEVHTLGDLIGSNPFRWTRAAAFLVANIATWLAFIFSRSVVLGHSLHPVYWQTAIVRGAAMTLATMLAFRFIRRGWVAAIVAGAGTVLLVVPVLHYTLLTFNLADVFYREQFQEFVLLPFVDVLVTLVALFFLIPRIRPLALALWVGAACAEVATSMLLTTLRDLGSGTPPDRILAGTLVFFVGVRSLVFAAAFWGGLKVTGMGRSAAK